jgi:hypothetical protein
MMASRIYSGVGKRLSRMVHTHDVAGSSPASATSFVRNFYTQRERALRYGLPGPRHPLTLFQAGKGTECRQHSRRGKARRSHFPSSIWPPPKLLMD